MLTTLVSWFLVIGVLILVHELGHFLAAKWVGIRVERFSLGFPPRLIGRKIGDTDYCLSAIPFGGYVKLSGIADIGSADTQGEPWEFGSKSVPARSLVIFAGPLLNFLFAFLVVFSVVYFGGSPVYKTTRIGLVDNGSEAQRGGLRPGDDVREIDGKAVSDWEDVTELLGVRPAPASVALQRGGEMLLLQIDRSSGEGIGIAPFLPAKVGGVRKKAPADRAGLQPGDVITSIDGERIEQWYGMQDAIRSRPRKDTLIGWRRGDSAMSAHIVPDAAGDPSRPGGQYGQIGITMGADYAYKPVDLVAALRFGWQSTLKTTSDLALLLGKLFTGALSSDTLGGVITIGKLAGDAARVGAGELLFFTALLSINLGFFNLLPIPVLDGGHLLFLGIEAVIRRPLPVRHREIVQRVGAVILASLIVYVTFNDIHRFFLR